MVKDKLFCPHGVSCRDLRKYTAMLHRPVNIEMDLLLAQIEYEQSALPRETGASWRQNQPSINPRTLFMLRLEPLMNMFGIVGVCPFPQRLNRVCLISWKAVSNR